MNGGACLAMAPPEFEHGGGVSHIKAKRDWEHQNDLDSGRKQPHADGASILRALPEVIAKGKIFGGRGGKTEIRQNGFVAIIKISPATKENPGEQWLLTGFFKSNAR